MGAHTADPISGDFAEEPFVRLSWPKNDISWITYTTAAETGVEVFYTRSGDGSGVRLDGGSFKTVFLPWMFDLLLEVTGMEKVPPVIDGDTRLLMGNVLEWFGTKKVTRIDNHESELVPLEFVLYQNYSNPFNTTTAIRYQIVDDGFPVHTTLKIFNILGQSDAAISKKEEEE